MATIELTRVDVDELRSKVQAMYEKVANEPEASFHFEMGRLLAERLGYQPSVLNRIPPASIRSFAGVGYFFDLVDLQPGENVLDLGSGSGMDSFIAAIKVGQRGFVTGIDMTDAQLKKAERLRDEMSFGNVSFQKAYLEEIPVSDGSADAVISNGVVNLCPDKTLIFQEISRVLKCGGRMAVADIVTDKDLTEKITCDATLWAACIGGAVRLDRYRDAIEEAGLRILTRREHPEYHFVSRSAQAASRAFGVKSISLLAVKVC